MIIGNNWIIQKTRVSRIVENIGRYVNYGWRGFGVVGNLAQVSTSWSQMHKKTI